MLIPAQKWLKNVASTILSVIFWPIHARESLSKEFALCTSGFIRQAFRVHSERSKLELDLLAKAVSGSSKERLDVALDVCPSAVKGSLVRGWGCAT